MSATVAPGLVVSGSTALADWSAAEADLAGYAVDGPPTVATAGLGANAGLIGAGLIAEKLV